MKVLLSVSLVVFLAMWEMVFGGIVRFLPWDQEIAGMEMKLVDGKREILIEGLHIEQRTGFYEVKDGTELRVRLADGSWQELTLPMVECGSMGDGGSLILLLPDDQHRGKVKLFLWDDRLSKRSWGGISFLNGSGQSKVIELDGHRWMVKQGGGVVQVKLGGAERGIGVRVLTVGDPENEEYTGVWLYEPETRVLVFIQPKNGEGEAGAVAFKVIREHRVDFEEDLKKITKQKGEEVKENRSQLRIDKTALQSS